MDEVEETAVEEEEIEALLIGIVFSVFETQKG